MALERVHYQRTAQDWLGNLDSHRDEIVGIVRKVCRNDTSLWMRCWRWAARCADPMADDETYDKLAIAGLDPAIHSSKLLFRED